MEYMYVDKHLKADQRNFFLIILTFNLICYEHGLHPSICCVFAIVASNMSLLSNTSCAPIACFCTTQQLPYYYAKGMVFRGLLFLPIKAVGRLV